MTRKVLLVDDDAAVRDALAQTLELADLEPVVASAFISAKDHIAQDFPGVVLSDIRMPGRDGFFLLDHVQQVDPDLPVVLLTGAGDIPMAVRAMSDGAFGFLEKPCEPADLLSVLERALKTRALVLENRRLKTLVESGDPAARMLVGHSMQAEVLRRLVRQVAQLETDVFIFGPPGAGVSKVAEVIHLCSSRSKAPLLKRAACDLTPEALAHALDEAKPGCLFLDEITQLPAASQLNLLDALEEDLPGRVFAGSSRDVEEAVSEKAFHPDLWYRFQVTQVRIPALAERREDIPVLFRHYVAQAAEQSGVEARDITPGMFADLMARDWPGDTRGLMSEAMRFVLGVDQPSDAAEEGLAQQMARVERTLLKQALERTKGNATAAAKALRLPRKTFYDKLTRHGLRAEDYRVE